MLPTFTLVESQGLGLSPPGFEVQLAISAVASPVFGAAHELVSNAITSAIGAHPQALDFAGRVRLAKNSSNGHTSDEMAGLVASDKELSIRWGEFVGGQVRDLALGIEGVDPVSAIEFINGNHDETNHRGVSNIGGGNRHGHGGKLPTRALTVNRRRRHRDEYQVIFGTMTRNLEAKCFVRSAPILIL